jgi:hypothetical protein
VASDDRPRPTPPQLTSDLTQIVGEEIAPEIGRFVGTIAGSPSFEIGELIAGHFRYRRFKQGINQMQKAQKLLENAGLDAHRVPMRTLVPLLEGVSTEDQESMSDRWAALLANAAGAQMNVPPSFPNVLSELEPIQAHMLDRAYDAAMLVSPELRVDRSFGISSLTFHLNNDDLGYHLDNLARVNLVSHAPDETGDLYRVLLITAFGIAFVRACRPPGTTDPPPQITTRQQLEQIVAANRERWGAEVRQAQSQGQTIAAHQPPFLVGGELSECLNSPGGPPASR